MSDWYKITAKDISGSLLNKYNSSPLQLLSTIYPNYEWLPWKFVQTPNSYWNDLTNQRKFLDWAAQELKIKDKSDWYKINKRDLFALGGGGLLIMYNSSPSKLLSTVYPEYEWLPWKFERCPRNFWNDNKNKKMFLDWAGKQLGIKEMSDWYKVSPKDVKSLGYVNEAVFSLPRMLADAYPEYNWEPQSFKSTTITGKKTQSLIKSMLKIMFPHEEVLEEYRHPDIVTSGGNTLELDFFYPKMNIAVEYQGQQHYKNIKIFQRHEDTIQINKQRDTLKINLCKEKGITLIEVPYWWNRKYESLAATIYAYRPDLFIEKPAGVPIPFSPSDEDRGTKKNSVSNILMTATEWDYENMDPTGWYMTEKYDGMRLYWSGTDFYSRQGKKVKVPEKIKNAMPKVSLDGELWTQYGLHQEAVSLSRTSEEEKWKKAVFWVFDTLDNVNKPYEERIVELQRMKEKEIFPSFVNIVQSVKCESKEHLKQYFDEIIAKGGEGVMLREPHSAYGAGRSENLRKYKPFFDTEVKVIENNYPNGLNCIQLDGKRVFVGFSDNYEEAKKLKEGDVLTVKFSGVNVYGTLQYPKFYRERTDVTWRELIKNIK